VAANKELNNNLFNNSRIFILIDFLFVSLKPLLFIISEKKIPDLFMTNFFSRLICLEKISKKIYFNFWPCEK
jgi:hypothetical protein